MNGTDERRALLTSAVAAVVIGCVALIAAIVSSASVILLDGLFNFVFFGAALFTLKVAKLLRRGDDEEFPLGYSFFEPFVNGLKGFLILGTSVWALIDAI